MDSLYQGEVNVPAAQPSVVEAVTAVPPLTEENWPLARLSSPPLTEEFVPVVVLLNPPLIEAN